MPFPSSHSMSWLFPRCPSISSGKMLVILRDGRKLHGVLRSYDQFGTSSLLHSPAMLSATSVANLVLEDTVERIYHGSAYAESRHGLFLIRGENVVLLGEIVSIHPFSLPLFTKLLPGLGSGRRCTPQAGRVRDSRILSPTGHGIQEGA